MRLDVADGLRSGVGDVLGVGDDGGLPGDAGRGVTGLGGAVVVDGRALDDGVDPVAVGDGVLQPLEDDHSGAAADHGAAGLGVEGAAVAVGREDHAFLVLVAPARRVEVDRADQGHVALAAEQGEAGGVQGDQRGRAGGVDVDGWTGQVELVGHPGGEEVLVVGEHQPVLVHG